MRNTILTSAVAVLVLALAGCSGDDATGSTSATSASGGAGGDGAGGAGGNGDGGLAGSSYMPAKLPALGDVFLTTDKTIVPVHDVLGDEDTDPRVPDQMDQMIAKGWGDTQDGPAYDLAGRTLDDSALPTPGAAPTRLTRFVHLADTQLADDESPARLAVLDSIGLTSGAFRPQEGSECRILNAAVRTINAVNKRSPVDFVVLGGDNADNAQDNELGWFLSILDGAAKVECDSGHDDDPTKGPDNDGKDPFFAEGLDVPWKWVTGNHDVLVQGNLVVASAQQAKAIGGVASTGTRDWSQPGGPVISGEVPADPRRKLNDRKAMLTRVNASGDGHGISSDVVKYGKAYYTFDTPDGSIRFLVVDSGAETGGADGVIHGADVDAFVKPALDKAKADHKLVIVTSHHISRAIGDGSDFPGTKQDDALTPQQWVDLLGSYDNVIMHLAGHTHIHRVTVAQPTSGHAYWEVETSALADFPFEMRFMEIWDQDNGFLSIRGIPLDYASDGDPVATEGRKRGTIDFVSSWAPDGRGVLTDRAVELWIPKPSL